VRKPETIIALPSKTHERPGRSSCISFDMTLGRYAWSVPKGVPESYLSWQPLLQDLISTNHSRDMYNSFMFGSMEVLQLARLTAIAIPVSSGRPRPACRYNCDLCTSTSTRSHARLPTLCPLAAINKPSRCVFRSPSHGRACVESVDQVCCSFARNIRMDGWMPQRRGDATPLQTRGVQIHERMDDLPS
jgi:hypothetical protein